MPCSRQADLDRLLVISGRTIKFTLSFKGLTATVESCGVAGVYLNRVGVVRDRLIDFAVRSVSEAAMIESVIARTNRLQGSVRTKDIWSGKAQQSLRKKQWVNPSRSALIPFDGTMTLEPAKAGISANKAKFTKHGRGRAHNHPEILF